MKQGWKTCKFADVFDLQMGKTPSRDNPTYWGDDNMWVSIADMNEQKYMSATKEGITDVAVQESGIKPIPKGTVIMSFKLSIGKVSIATSKLYTNEAIMGFIEKEEGTLVPEYLYYYLKGYKWEGANKAAMGMTLNKKTIAENTISYPPIAEQEKIVAELDCLSGIIEKKKQQLKELDNLAQSIFYEMFGNPLENEKEWKVCKLGDISIKIANGYNAKLEKDTYKPNGIPYFRCQNIWWNYIDYTDIVYIDEMTNDKMKTSSLMTGDLIISKIGRVNTENSSLGRTAIYEGENRKANISGNLCYVRLNNSVVPKFVLRILTLERYRRWAMQTTPGGIDKRAMSVSQISNFPIITPPIGLQQTFVSKIESIEKQKELIAQSIKETETLFNSRMDYYFN